MERTEEVYSRRQGDDTSVREEAALAQKPGSSQHSQCYSKPTVTPVAGHIVPSTWLCVYQLNKEVH